MKRKRKRSRGNPDLITLSANPSSAAAAAAFEKFHRTKPKSIRQLGGKGPSLIALGDLLEVVYRPTRGVRRGPAFVHKFGRGAVLAATADGRELVCVPGKGKPFRVDWERGIVG